MEHGYEVPLQAPADSNQLEQEDVSIKLETSEQYESEEEESFPMPEPIKEELTLFEELFLKKLERNDVPVNNVNVGCVCGRCKVKFSNIKDYAVHVGFCSKICLHCCKSYETLDSHLCLGGSASAPHEEITISTAYKICKNTSSPKVPDIDGEGTAMSTFTAFPKNPVPVSTFVKLMPLQIGSTGMQENGDSLMQLTFALPYQKEKQSPKHKCSFCNTLFDSVKLMTDHMNGHHGALPFPCEYCKLTFSSASELSGHNASHPEAVAKFLRYMCQECGEIFTDGKQLKDHMKMNEELYRCHLCTEPFRKNEILLCHLLEHPEYKPHACHKCDAAFKSEDECRRHLREHKLNVFKCDFCKGRFKRMSDLTEHLPTHSPFECHACGAMFPLIEDWEYHLVTNGHEYKCDYCGMGFSYKRDLRGHIFKHAQNINGADLAATPVVASDP